VFAGAELGERLSLGEKREDILAGLHRAMWHGQWPGGGSDAGEWSMHADLTLDAFLGYVGTWSAVVKARAAEGQDPVEDLRAAIAAPWGDPRHARRVTWPLNIRAGRKPEALA